MLRQNPHNVAEWHKRVNLFKGDPTKQVCTGDCTVRWTSLNTVALLMV